MKSIEKLIKIILVTFLFLLFLPACSENDPGFNFDGIYKGSTEEGSAYAGDVRAFVDGNNVKFTFLSQKINISGSVSEKGEISIREHGIILIGEISPIGRMKGSFETILEVEGIFTAHKE